MDLNESSGLANKLTSIVSWCSVWGNGCNNGNSSGLGDAAGDITNSFDVLKYE